MKYCYACGTVSPGNPFFCISCGRTYSVKLCPRRHMNPRYAEACSECGSRDLSTPQPKVSVWWKITELLVRVFLGILLAFVSLSVIVALLRTPVMQAMLIVLGFMIAALWAIWIMLPEWFRKFIHWLIKRRARRDE